MHPVSKKSCVLVMGGLLLVACGGGLSPEEYPEAYDEAWCHRQARCGGIRDEDACVRSGREIARAEREAGVAGTLQYEGSIRSGRLRFNEEAARACVQRLEDSSCNESVVQVRADPRCDFLEGQQQEGEPCVITEECGPASYCERRDEPICVTSTCKPLPGLGEPVGDIPMCAPGLVPMGETCQPRSDEGGACGSDTSCTPGLYCDVLASWTCRRFVVEGEACGTGMGAARCLPHLRCAEGSCHRLFDVGMACTPPPPRDPDGVHVSECKWDLFCEGVAGSGVGTCRERLGPGEPCTDNVTCREGLFCDWQNLDGNGRCHPLRELGESCGRVPCVPGAYCNFELERCMPQGQLGQPCPSRQLYACRTYLSCSRDNRCEPIFGGLCGG